MHEVHEDMKLQFNQQKKKKENYYYGTSLSVYVFVAHRITSQANIKLINGLFDIQLTKPIN